MDICQREGLYQVDLLSPAAEKITQQEYHAQRRGQLNLDMANMEIMAEGIAPMKTKFETNKEKIRNAIYKKEKIPHDIKKVIDKPSF